MVRLILAFSFCDQHLVVKIMCTGNRAQYCGLCYFRTVIRWFGVAGSRKVIIGRASSISPWVT